MHFKSIKNIFICTKNQFAGHNSKMNISSNSFIQIIKYITTMPVLK